MPTDRAAWAQRGQRPKASSRRRDKWRYGDAFVHLESGRSIHSTCSSVDTDRTAAVLVAYVAEADIGPHQHVVLVLHGAGWHLAKRRKVPSGGHLVFLPECSPESQPAERLFPLVSESWVNRTSWFIEALEDVVAQRLRDRSSDSDIVSSHTRLHGWPSDVRAEQQRDCS